MALVNVTDATTVAAQLNGWLSSRMPDADSIEVRDVNLPQSSGLSNETVLFDASWKQHGNVVDRRLVARVAPTGPALFPSYNLELEATVMRALREHTPVPVPEVLFYEGDSTVLGAPFIVMGRVDGKAAADDPPFTAQGWVMDLTPAQRATMADNGLQALAAIHQVDWRAAGLGVLDRSDEARSPLDVVIDDWRAVFTWAAGDRANPTVEAGFEWLDANRPSEVEPKVLNWGDARFGNLLIKDDLSVGAVLDWEMVGVGAPEMDLGWWLFLFRHHTDGIGVPAPDGFPSARDVIERYEALTGHKVRNLHYYEVLAALRLSILTQRAANLLIGAGIIPADAPMALNNPATNLLASLADLPSPGGLTATPMTRGN